MKRFFVKSVSILLCAFFLFYGFTALLLFAGPRAFAENYQQGYIYQYRALERAKGEKIITIGGSNVSFNVNTELMTSLTGIPAYNLGIHADMGYCYVFEDAEPMIGKGDKVIFPLWPFTKDDYGSTLIWITLEGQPDLIGNFISRHPVEALTSVGSFSLKKLYALTMGRLADGLKAIYGDETAWGYKASSFDPDTGNMTYVREEPVSPYGVMLLNQFRFEPDNLSEWYVSYINAFIDRCRAKGAEVYLTYPTIMRESLVMTDEEVAAYESFAKEQFHAEFITDFLSVCYEYEDYFNIATHLNSAGMDEYTTALAEGLLSAIG